MIDQENSSCKKNVTCVECGKTIKYIKGVGRSSRKLCDKTCLAAYRKRIADIKKINFECAVCKAVLKINPNSKRVTCGKACFALLLSKRYTGRRLTDEWKQKQNISKQAENIRKYGEFACSSCSRVFKSNTSLRAHHATCHAKDEYGEFQCACGATLKTARALKQHKSLVHCEEKKVESRKKKILERAQNRVNQTRSQAESNFFNELTKLDATAVSGYKIPDCNHQFDVFIPSYNLLIEFDGDYWHGNKEKYARTARMKRQRAIDVTYSNFACENGFNLIRVWQSDSKEFLRQFKEAYNVGFKVCENFIDQKKWRKASLRSSDEEEPQLLCE